MLNQYKEETSQIHAPADLILKTKQAVREEELRVQQEQKQHGQIPYADQMRQTLNDTARNADLGSAEKANVYDSHVGGKSKNGYGKVYKWALPVAAAVLFVLFINASAWMIGNRFTKSQSDTASDMTASETAAGGAEYELAEAAAEEPDGTDAGGGKTFADAEAAAESAATADEDGTAYDMYEESATEEAASAAEEMPRYEYGGAEDAANETGLNEDAGSDLVIEEVEEIPSFCDDPDTECINVRGLPFYVARERGNQWKAYVSAADSGYLITGSSEGIPDQKSFAGMAYELLAETVEGIEN